jgi:hypothetical protein
VLTLGVTTCTVTSLVFLPILLSYLRPGHDAQPAADTEPEAAQQRRAA